MRVRELLPALYLGRYQTGLLNSLTDVPGVKVHTQEIFKPEGTNTGVTCIIPREEWAEKACYAGTFTFNGAGELTGCHWINETGLFNSPIVLTNTLSVGAAHEGICRFAVNKSNGESIDYFILPVVGETFDGLLNNIASFAVRPEHVIHGLESVTSDRVREGNVGGGTGMMCHYFKGGTGSSSRIVPGKDAAGNPKSFTVGALVQANYGAKRDFKIGGAPVGRILAQEDAILAEKDRKLKEEQQMVEDHKIRKDGSIIIILATDAPLNPVQLQRLARRATVGLARVGGYGTNSSGDIFLAFSTANAVPVESMTDDGRSANPFQPEVLEICVSADDTINGLFEAAADVVEESIYNALCMAEDMTGFEGRKVSALPLGRVRDIMEKYL